MILRRDPAHGGVARRGRRASGKLPGVAFEYSGTVYAGVTIEYESAIKTLVERGEGQE